MLKSNEFKIEIECGDTLVVRRSVDDGVAIHIKSNNVVREFLYFNPIQFEKFVSECTRIRRGMRN